MSLFMRARAESEGVWVYGPTMDSKVCRTAYSTTYDNGFTKSCFRFCAVLCFHRVLPLGPRGPCAKYGGTCNIIIVYVDVSWVGAKGSLRCSTGETVGCRAHARSLVAVVSYRFVFFKSWRRETRWTCRPPSSSPQLRQSEWVLYFACVRGGRGLSPAQR